MPLIRSWKGEVHDEKNLGGVPLIGCVLISHPRCPLNDHSVKFKLEVTAAATHVTVSRKEVPVVRKYASPRVVVTGRTCSSS